MFCVPKPKHQKVHKNHVKKRLEMILKLAVIQLMIGWSSNLFVKGKKTIYCLLFDVFSDDILFLKLFLNRMKNMKIINACF